jgi:hypothetical protein
MSDPEDRDGWAKPVERLEVLDVPEGAKGQTVHDRRLTSPLQGFGQMWQKTYRVSFGLTEHYREIFSLTRLDEAIRIFDDEPAAVAV